MNKNNERNELMQPSAKSEIARHAETLFEKFEKFQETYPEQWESISTKLYQITDMNAADLVNLLQAFSEVAK